MRRFRGQPPEGDGRFAAGWISGVGSAVVVAGGLRLAQWVGSVQSVEAVVTAFEQFATQPRISLFDLSIVAMILLIAVSASMAMRLFGGVSA